MVDAYTRLGLITGNAGYETIRAAFETALGADVPLFNEYHTLIVRHGKDRCRTRPRCADCCLRTGCPRADGPPQ